MTVLLRWFIPITLYYIAFGLMDNTGWESLLIGLLFAGGVLINVLSHTNKN
ncbi:hypothetical protein JOC34_000623 [Virgibacillus halotolerans]|uniref:hypothetical protein n=1 Tax=Virgibacillus halotolerans TaxID=1071053 RepID=UPI001961BA5D|nr:hypothetical protein [Virgibacillus halotolerans]MBM7598266.1 hypothetical protein [Virgibacillus halotolerans]